MKKQKRIYLNSKKTKYCVVKLFLTKKEMQEAYKKACPGDNHHPDVQGAHNAYTLIKIGKDGKSRLSKETGTIYLHFLRCGAGVATHEIMHAILWARRHTKNKKQYPIVINNMKEEEEILYNFTSAVCQFYLWYWKVEPLFRKAYEV